MMTVREKNKEIKKLTEYKEFLKELKKIGKKFNKTINASLISEYKVDEEVSKVKDRIKFLLCNHENTHTQLSWDSHYDYEDTICNDCGHIIDSVKC